VSDLPNSWISVQLGDVIDYGNTSKAEPTEIAGDSWILELEDIEKTTSKLTQQILFSERQSKSTKNKFEKNDVLYGKLRPYLDKVIIANESGKYLDNRFLFYGLKRKEFIDYVSEVSHGLNMPRLGTKQGQQAPFVLAPLNEQIRIANKLDSLLAKVDTAQARLEKIPTLLKRFRQSVLAAATSGELTREWRNNLDPDWLSVSLKDVATGFNYGSSAKSQSEGDVPVLRMGNLQGGKLDWTDLVYSSDKTEIEKYLLEAGDVLFNRTNSPELVGKTSIYRGERQSIFAGYLIRIKGSERLNSEYLNILLNSPHARDYCWQVKTDGVSQSNINAKKIQAYEFELPTIQEQTEIVRRVESLFVLADTVEKQYLAAKQRLDRLSQSLLAKAFRGELVPQDPNDEPAAELLKRIQAERQAQPVANQKRSKSA
jgi:type I restriction enzyme S subunit